MKFTEIETGSVWFTFRAIGEYQSPTKPLFIINPDTAGFIRCNDHQYGDRYFQVILSIDAIIIGEYIAEKRLIGVIDQVSALSNQSRAENYWHSYWVAVANKSDLTRIK